jgi:hypothetical protein
MKMTQKRKKKKNLIVIKKEEPIIIQQPKEAKINSKISLKILILRVSRAMLTMLMLTTFSMMRTTTPSCLILIIAV